MEYGQNRNIIILIANILIIYFLIRFLIKNYKNMAKIVRLSLIMMISGGISNLLDRILRGYVVDYIDVTKILEYPIFNLADIAIVIGGILAVGYIIIKTIKKQENAQK